MSGRLNRMCAALIGVTLVAAGCDGGSPPASAPAGAGASAGAGSGALPGAATTFDDVTFSDKAVVVDEAAVRSGLRGEDGRTYRFAAGTPGVDKLASGSIMLVAGKAVRRVTGVDTRGDEVVVRTVAARIDQLISTGTVGWRTPVTWRSVPKEAFRQIGLATTANDGTPRIVNAAYEPDGADVSLTGKVKGFDVKVKLGTKGAGLDFEIEAKRVLADAKATDADVRVTAKGTISNFVQEARLVYDQGKAALVRADALGLKGDVEVTWAAVGHGSAGLDRDTVRLELPFEVPIPVTVGGIPFVVKMKSTMRIVPVLSEDTSSGGSFKVTYDSDLGFDAKTVTPVPNAAIRGADAQLGSKDTVSAGYVPVGFGWGWEFPRLELSVAGVGTFAVVTLDTYSTGEWTPGTTLTKDIPPCQKATLTLHAIAIFKLELLGLSASRQITLWERKFEKYKDGRPCTLTGKPR